MSALYCKKCVLPADMCSCDDPEVIEVSDEERDRLMKDKLEKRAKEIEKEQKKKNS